MKDRLLQPGVQQVVELSAGVRDLSGYQFTLAWDTVHARVEKLEFGLSGPEHIGDFRNKGFITTSWDRFSAPPVDTGKDNLLFQLWITPKSKVWVRQLFQLDSRPTSGLAVNGRDETMPVRLNFSSGTMPGDWALLQNFPNPFSERTSVPFTLQVPGRVFLTIRDTGGRVVWEQEKECPAGYQEIAVPGSSLPTGVLFYTLETPEGRRTRRMIRLE